MKLTILLLLATLMFANTHNFTKVYVSKDMTLTGVQMINNTLFHNGKKIDSRYSIVSCKKSGGYCLIEKGNIDDISKR